MSRYTRDQIAAAILDRLNAAAIAKARWEFDASKGAKVFQIDDLLPEEMATAIRAAFPQPGQMRERKTLREHKYVAAQMNRFHPQAEEALFAFHDPAVIERISAITCLQDLSADARLYAGGISLMRRGNFLNPHLDNSHDSDRRLYRALNLLYYVSPGWSEADGGSLELWPDGIKSRPLIIPATFNRLVVMTTGPDSWHSVSAIRSELSRCCVSNYYFSSQPVGGAPYFRVTSFRGRPEQPLRDFVLRVDARIRQALRMIRPKGFALMSHIYDRDKKSL